MMKHNQYEILTPDGWSEFSGVRKTSSKNILIISTEASELKCTFDHKLYKKNVGFIDSINLKVNDAILTAAGYEIITAISDTSSFLSNEESDIAVYDVIDVKLKNMYFTNSILSHNCEFQGSSGTLIDGATLKLLDEKTPIKEKDGLFMYEEPEPGSIYVCIADVSRGKGLDYSAFHIIDVTQMPYNQVCVYRDNMTTPLDYAETIHRICKSYNDALILVEINDIGAQVVDSLHEDYMNEMILYTESAGRAGKKISTGFGKGAGRERGIRTTKSVKALGCSMLKLIIEQKQLIINDWNTIEELSKFSRSKGSYAAEPGSTDDLVMGLVLFAWMTDQTYFKDFTDINTLSNLRDRNKEKVIEDLMPFGFYDDGHDIPVEDEDGWITEIAPEPKPWMIW